MIRDVDFPDTESGLYRRIEEASKDLVALFLVADEQAEGFPCPEAWQDAGMSLTERNRRWKELWRRSGA